MVERCHPEDTFTGGFKDADLNDIRENNRDEQASHDDGEQLRLREHRQAGDSATKSESTRVAHEDLSGRRVPPQEARQRTNERGTENRKVKGVTRRVAGRLIRPELRARLNALEVRDECVGTEHEDGHTRRQTIQAIGQVRRIRPRRHNEIRPDQIQDDTHAEPRKAQRQGRGPREGNRQCSGIFAELVRHDEGSQREERCDGNLADNLARRMQTERTLAHDLDAVIKQSDDAQAHKQEHEEQAGPRRSGTGDQRTNQPGHHGRQNDDNAAHGGRAALGQVLGRPILADELTVLVQHQEADEQRRTRH